jgi:hypothetical protein
MKFRIDPTAGTVEIDGRIVAIDLSGFDPEVAEVNWFGAAGVVTYKTGGDEEGARVERITSTAAYAGFIAAAQAEIVARDTPVPPTLADHKASAAAWIDAAAGQARLQFITDVPGQEMSYAEKAKQAAAFKLDLEPTQDKYPAIYGEVGITAETTAGVADAILARYESWRIADSIIEPMRLGAKKAVAAAADAAAILAILEALTWPSPS